MKFPRHSRLLRSSFDLAPFATVLFLLVMFLLLGAFLPTSGLPLRLPRVVHVIARGVSKVRLRQPDICC